MAEVLAAHWSRSTHSDSEPFVDKCDGCGAVIYSWGDDPAWEGIEPLAAHQAEVLSAAGFGKANP
jgi:murein endopeptidase